MEQRFMKKGLGLNDVDRLIGKRKGTTKRYMTTGKVSGDMIMAMSEVIEYGDCSPEQHKIGKSKERDILLKELWNIDKTVYDMCKDFKQVTDIYTLIEEWTLYKRGHVTVDNVRLYSLFIELERCNFVDYKKLQTEYNRFTNDSVRIVFSQLPKYGKSVYDLSKDLNITSSTLKRYLTSKKYPTYFDKLASNLLVGEDYGKAIRAAKKTKTKSKNPLTHLLAMYDVTPNIASHSVTCFKDSTERMNSLYVGYRLSNKKELNVNLTPYDLFYILEIIDAKGLANMRMFWKIIGGFNHGILNWKVLKLID